MVFESVIGGRRFALHVENKRDTYRFNEGQAAAYEARARHMMGRAEFLNYRDFATVLLAPSDFKKRYKADSDLFEVFISYEEVARFLPTFLPTG